MFLLTDCCLCWPHSSVRGLNCCLRKHLEFPPHTTVVRREAALGCVVALCPGVELTVLPSADERHGLGGRGGAHAGRCPVPRGDRGGWQEEPALGAINPRHRGVTAEECPSLSLSDQPRTQQAEADAALAGRCCVCVHTPLPCHCEAVLGCFVLVWGVSWSPQYH